MSQTDQSGKSPVRKLGRGLSALLGSPVQIQVPGPAVSPGLPAARTPVPAVGTSAPSQAIPKSPSSISAASTSGSMAETTEEGTDGIASSPPESSFVRDIHVEQVYPNRRQPRTDFSEEALQSLAASIKQAGLMQPIVVRSTDRGYELIAGERRWRAAKLLGMSKIPAVVKDIDDQTAAELALIENIQREDLNPMERAVALKRLSSDFNLTHQEIADRVGLDRASVTNLLRLADLDRSTSDLVRAGKITQGHAKALLGVTDIARRAELAAKVLANDWSVRELERQVQSGHKRPSVGGETSQGTSKEPTARDANVADLEKQLADYLGTRVSLQLGRKKGSGRLVLDFYTLDQFDGLMQKIGFGGR